MKMKKIFKFLPLLLLVFFACAKKTDQTPKKGFFWKLNINQKHIYFLGSSHLASENFYPLNSQIMSAFEKSDYLVVEVDIRKQNTIDIRKYIIESGTYSNEDTLTTKLPKKIYKNLLEEADKIGISEDFIKNKKPWLVSIILAMTKFTKLGFDKSLGVENYFFERLKKQKVLELESILFQLKILSSFNEEESLLMLKNTLIELKTMKKLIEKIEKNWKVGNAKALEQVIFKNFKKDKLKDAFDILFTKRNINMAKKIEQYFKDDKNYFIIVGAGHYIGDKGIISLLKAKGYDIPQIK